MFEDSFLESGGKYSTQTRRAPWAPVASFTIEAALIGVLLLIPFIYTETLPKLRLTKFVIAVPPSAPVPIAVEKEILSARTELSGGRIMAPQTIPRHIAMNVSDPGPLPSTVTGVSGSTGLPGNMPLGIPESLLNAVAITPVPSVRQEPHRRVKVSEGVISGLLIRKVEPNYPQLAKVAHISGEVVLQAVIGKSGSMEQLRVVSGHPMLVKSAMEAVRQWKYQPFLLNGEPVEVDTQVTVNFTLIGG